MKSVLKKLLFILTVVFILLSIYAAIGWNDAVSQSDKFAARANTLIAEHKGGDALGKERLAILIKVQDPNFYNHNGVDFFTPGAGKTTLTQSLSKRLAFNKFLPGIQKIRQTGFALGLDSKLTKAQQIALFLNTAEMGESKKGGVTGFFKASQIFYGNTPQNISKDQFINLVAVLIAPEKLSLNTDNAALKDRAARIKQLIAGQCVPRNHNDVWLQDCKN